MFDLRKTHHNGAAHSARTGARPTPVKLPCLNRNALEAWLRDPPAMKPMAPGEVDEPQSRGMPNLNLTETQIDQLVAYLETLK